jgi:hypothetical protein
MLTPKRCPQCGAPLHRIWYNVDPAVTHHLMEWNPEEESYIEEELQVDTSWQSKVTIECAECEKELSGETLLSLEGRDAQA